jgi:hypothetical protein
MSDVLLHPLLNNAEFFANIREYAQIAANGDKMPVSLSEKQLRDCLTNAVSYEDPVCEFVFSDFHELILLNVKHTKSEYDKTFIVVTNDDDNYDAIVSRYKNVGEYRQLLNRFIVDYKRHEYAIDHNFYNLLPVYVSGTQLERLAEGGSIYCTLDELYYTVNHIHSLSKGIYFMIINNKPITVVNYESNMFVGVQTVVDNLRLECMRDIAKSITEDIAISKSNGITQVRLRSELSSEALAFVDGFIYNNRAIRVKNQLIFIDDLSYPIHLF